MGVRILLGNAAENHNKFVVAAQPLVSDNVSIKPFYINNRITWKQKYSDGFSFGLDRLTTIAALSLPSICWANVSLVIQQYLIKMNRSTNYDTLKFESFKYFSLYSTFDMIFLWSYPPLAYFTQQICHKCKDFSFNLVIKDFLLGMW